MMNLLQGDPALSPMAPLINDLISSLQAAESLWSEGMKLDAVLLADVSLLQRDNLLGACRQASQAEQTEWRSQSFASSCIFGLDASGFRRPSRPPIAPDATLHTGETSVPLELVDRVLLASEMRTLTASLEDPPL